MAMKLKAVLNNKQYELALDLNGPEVVAGVDGRSYSLQVRASDESSYLILNGTNVYECRVTGHGGSLNTLDVTVRGNTYPVTVIDPRKLPMDGDSDRHHHGTAEIAAQMPGKVVRVLVEAGQEIASGTPLLVVEAMKMQNEMKSPRAGVVVSVKVSAGDTVEAGQLLAMIE
jgi:biotin carboxyl carrier protein